VSEKTNIPWADHTFNIAWGCAKVSEGCQNCYAEVWSRRTGRNYWGFGADRRTFGEKHWAEPLAWNRKAEREGVRRRVFSSSMCDPFEPHPIITREREKLWPLIRETPHLDWLLLTKRAGRINQCLPSDWGQGYPNVWPGVTAEEQLMADERIHLLFQTPAAVRFVCVEPMLGPIDLHLGKSRKPAWVVVGGESGPNARPCRVEWIRDAVRQCREAGVACYVKQLGRYAILDPRFRRDLPGGAQRRLLDPKGAWMDEWPEDLRVREFPEVGR